MPASTADERLPLTTKLFYGAGDLTNSLFNTILAVHVLYFLINVVGLPGGLASIAIFLSLVSYFILKSTGSTGMKAGSAWLLAMTAARRRLNSGRVLGRLRISNEY